MVYEYTGCFSVSFVKDFLLHSIYYKIKVLKQAGYKMVFFFMSRMTPDL